MAAKPKSQILTAQIKGGQWRLDIVFETKDGAILEGTRTEMLYAESQMSGDVSSKNVGTLLRGRTRELLKREGL